MEPKYSILFCNQQYSEYKEKVHKWLLSGIKVIWFSQSVEEVNDIRSDNKSFEKAFLLMAYTVDIEDSITIVDGENSTDFIEGILEKACPLFNSAQYLVEHCKAGEHIVVQASAGTGKTKVMVDRIMYLLHMYPELHLPEMFMITFTNEAAQQMNARLQDAFMTRYELTRDKKYLRWLEEQSQMHISTIHSFAYYLLKQYGIGESFTKNLNIRTFEYERKELIKDAIDEKIDANKSVRNQLGVPFYRANSIISDYWHKFSQLGVSHKDLVEMDWGEGIDEGSYAFHGIIKDMMKKLDDGYFDIKRKEDSISIDDIMRDLQDVLANGNLPNTDLSMKYLFIDEFQDSDLSQIRVACLLVNILNATLFVVGDVKQSIYRFRGANDRAFFLLKNDMKQLKIKDAIEFTLVNNYRTAQGVLDRLDTYFYTWGRQGILDYDKAVIPFNLDKGFIKMYPVDGKDEAAEQQIINLVNRERDLLIKKVEESGKEPTEKNRVVILTRSNKELNDVGRLLRRARIPISIHRDGFFYASEAVRDFYMMVSSFMFCDEPKYVFNYLLTPYAGDIEPLDLNKMERLSGDYDNLVDYMSHFVEQTHWADYHKQLRLKPVMAVFKEMIDNEPIIDSFIALNKAKRKAEGYEDDRRDADTFTRARQYQANLEKLMEILQHNLNGDKVSLYDVYNFLKLNIATNRNETEAKVQSKDDYTSVLCMTVHKSKGLEFDTVIIPFTDENFGGWASTELLIDPLEKKVGWNYTGDKEKKKKRYKYPPMKNTYYDDLKADDIESGEKEGVRVLYVGLTRAIDRLICIVEESKNPMSWAKLIEEVGVDYE